MDIIEDLLRGFKDKSEEVIGIPGKSLFFSCLSSDSCCCWFETRSEEHLLRLKSLSLSFPPEEETAEAELNLLFSPLESMTED